MEAGPQAHGLEKILDGLTAEAVRRFGVERLDELRPVLERTALELEAIARFEIGMETAPAFYVNDLGPTPTCETSSLTDPHDVGLANSNAIKPSETEKGGIR